MKLRILAAGTKMPQWVSAGYQEYVRRLPAPLRPALREIALARRSGATDVARAVSEEGKRMLSAIGDQERVVALHVEGQGWSTERLANRLGAWMQGRRDVSFLIGGPDGLAAPCMQRAELHWSLSPLTLPHGLVRIVLAEQLYRAWSLLTGHPYHRD